MVPAEEAYRSQRTDGNDIGLEMAEGRMLKKRISKSKKLARLKTDRARLLYLMSIPHLDVEGRIDADPKLIKGRVVPYLKYSEKGILECFKDMARAGLIKLYKVDDDLYAEFTRFGDFQHLRLDREAKSEIPPPSKGEIVNWDPNSRSKPGEPQEDSGSAPGEVKLSKGKLSKAEPSAALKAALDKILKDGLNIYALMNKIKKESKVKAVIPEEVLLKVCDAYWLRKPDIKKPWPWFGRVLVAEWQDYNARKNIAEHQAVKDDFNIFSFKQIIEKVVKND